MYTCGSCAGNEPDTQDGSSKGDDGAGTSKAAAKKEEEPSEGVKKEPDDKDLAGEGGDDEETYELDATQLLNAFKAEESIPEEPEMDPEALMKTFMDDMKDVDRNNEVHRVLAAFKLNPFEQLNLRFTATEQEVKRAYKYRSPIILYLFILETVVAAHLNASSGKVHSYNHTVLLQGSVCVATPYYESETVNLLLFILPC